MSLKGTFVAKELALFREVKAGSAPAFKLLFLRYHEKLHAFVLALSSDPFLAEKYSQVTGPDKGVILEIRRERSIELVMEGFRWDDIMRWKAGQLLVRPFNGEYFPGPGSYDLDGDANNDLVLYTGDKPAGTPGVQYLELGSDITLENGTSGGKIIVNPNITKVFNEDRDYLYPIPTEELLLNPNLDQNPGWQ
ncbi:SusD-like starch-binding protein associating with outer membrane [Anseongella ginsenosidimutans]|uniref:SusD-like starch-binding protein associating with outer membrane n=1 Tax=Anseongella ginsenosidimutans TaxID=496056 RepID=A0A4R3KX90_9SPHI|nr:RagB/SusD family nutrient uptake outer membrane protein [Anseongella ginsenosidimutans]QEC51266.1 RagB/SusD family nutrient uptake outer membrane protein [Anseongella ginsenosidimutans]TCS90048.1 SusD-like starch-binding protein associating with outer membrane [Anseongella ginsenosidimutans]